MANVAGRGFSRAVTGDVSATTRAGTERGRAPLGLALTETVRENAADTDTQSLLELLVDGRENDDDFPAEDDTPDLGVRDDDEPFQDEPDERPSVLPSRPEIELWATPSGVRWEVRTIASALLEDDLLPLAVRRERTLEQYATGLATEMLNPTVLGVDPRTADLASLWDALPVRNPHDPYDEARWNTQAAISTRWGVDASTASRDRELLVLLPNGRVVPLQFFTWKTENDDLVRAIAQSETLFSGSIASVSTAVTPQPRAQRTAKDLVPWVRAAVRHRHFVSRARDQFRSHPSRFASTVGRLQDALTLAEVERVSHEGGQALGKQDRALPVLYRALIGGLP